MNTFRVPVAARIKNAETPAEELRETLTLLEAEIGKLGTTGVEQPSDILLLLDHAEELYRQLTEREVDLTPERTRLDTIQEQLRSKGKQFLKQIGGAGALSTLREHYRPSPNQWWWFIDQYLAEKRRARMRQTLRALGLAAVILVILSLVYSRFLAPDQATQQRLAHEQAAEQALSQGDFTLALTEAEQALQFAPQDGDLLTLKGVALALMGRPAEANEAFTAAQQAIADDETFYFTRSRLYLVANRADLGLADAKRIVALKPNSALGYFQMGNANSMLGNYLEASQNYEKASELARAAGQTELEGMARVQLANVSMLLMAPKASTPTPIP